MGADWDRMDWEEFWRFLIVFDAEIFWYAAFCFGGVLLMVMGRKKWSFEAGEFKRGVSFDHLE